MKVKIKDLQSNPFKMYITNGRLSKERIDILKESVEMGTLPKRFYARKSNGVLEILYGHHRLEALRQVKGEEYEVDVTLVDYNDEQMLIDMVRENLTQRDTDYRDVADSCMLAKVWLESGAKLLTNFTTSRQGKRTDLDSNHITARQIAEFLSKQGKAISHAQVSKYIRIEEQAIDEIKEKVVKSKQGHVEEGKLGVEVSAALSAFPKEEQGDLLRIVEESKLNRDEIRKLLTEYKNAPFDIVFLQTLQ
jgi:hypothetical protein